MGGGMRQKKGGGEMTTTIEFTNEELWLLQAMARSHADKIEADVELSKDLETKLGLDETKHIDYLEAEKEKTYALWEKIENKEKENFKK